MTIRRVSLLCAVLLLATAPLAAQVWTGRGRLQGQVIDENQQPIAGAKITLRWNKDPSSGPPVITTDKGGRWAVLGLAGGAWTALIEAPGFVTAEGPAEVRESGGPAPPLRITLRAIPKEQAGGGPEAAAVKADLERGNALLRESKWAEARAAFEKALPQIAPEHQPMIQRAIAQTWTNEGQPQKAIELLTPIAASASSDVETAKALAQAHLAAKQPEQALVVLGSAKAAAPADSGILRLTAQAYIDQKKTEEAISAVKQAVEATPDDAELLNLLASLLVDAGREEEAKTYIARLPQGAKIDPVSLLNIGIKQYNDNKMTEALSSFDRVVQENPELAEAYYYRGMAYLAQAKVKESKADLEKFLALEPNHAKAADARLVLKEM